MKNFIMKILLSITIVIAFLSCKKNDSFSQESKIDITSKTYNEQIEYADSHLKVIGTEIAKLATDKNFVTFIHEEVKKKFDTEYEVLVNDLKKNANWSDKLNIKTLNESLDAFKNIEGSTFYPQIYIPRFQNDEDYPNSTNSKPDAAISNQIVYVYYSGDAEVDSSTSEQNSYPGYILNSNNQMQFWGMVNEDYANNNEVWIISINEVVNNDGNNPLPCVADECAGSGGGGGGVGSIPCTGVDCDPAEFPSPMTPVNPNMGTHLPVNCKIEKMMIKECKESWLAGASEIAIRAKLNCHNNLTDGKPSPAATIQYKSDQYSNYLGRKIAKFKRKAIKNRDIVYVNYSLQTNWPTQFYLIDPIYFDYIIFERDVWPAPLNPIGSKNGIRRQDLFAIPFTGLYSDDWNQKYRSQKKKYEAWNFPYSQGSLTSNLQIATSQNVYYASGFVNNSDISFNTIGY
jgi:hypothetical protein